MSLDRMVGNFSEGRSGGFFFTTADRRYLVKTIGRKERRRGCSRERVQEVHHSHGLAVRELGAAEAAQDAAAVLRVPAHQPALPPLPLLRRTLRRRCTASVINRPIPSVDGRLGCYCLTMHGQSRRFAVMESLFHAACS